MVWAARLRGTRGFEKLVAIKTMLPGMSDDASFERMFLDEAKLAARVHSPHVVEILDLGEERGVLYIVMEWVEGEPLNEIMRAASRVGPIPLEVAVSILMQACAGIHAAHELRDEQGNRLDLVHRDISPHNVLVGFDGIAKVSDFGIAKAMAMGGASTEVGEVKGKTAYMSPEQAIGAALDRRSDVFALGVVLYQLTTGTHPFRGQTDGETIANIVLPDPPARPTLIVPGYARSLEAVVMKALAKEVVARHQSASALLADLNGALPSSARGAMSYESVGAYVESLLGARRAERRERLKIALAASEERAVLDSPPPLLGDSGSSTRRKTALIATGVVIFGVAGGVVWAGRGAAGGAGSTARSAARILPSMMAPTVAPTASTTIGSEPSGLSPQETASTPIAQRYEPPAATTRPRAKLRAAPAASKPPASRASSSPQLSPVRTPGF